MSKSNAVTIEAKTVEQALVIASGKLGVSQDEIEYEVTKKASGGILSFFSASKVEIKAWKRHSGGRGRDRDQQQRNGRDQNNRYSNNYGKGNNRGGASKHDRNDSGNRAETKSQERRPRHDKQNEAEAKPSTPAEPLTEQQVESLRLELQDFCKVVCEKISDGEPTEVLTSIKDGRLQLDIRNEYIQDQIQRNAKLAEALEHLIRKKPRHLKQELPFRIFIDANGNRKSREEELAQLAVEMSLQVFENQKPIVLNYKSSYDRKIIHMALEKDDRVYTKSIGTGPNRKLMILPSKNGKHDESESVPS